MARGTFDPPHRRRARPFGEHRRGLTPCLAGALLLLSCGYRFTAGQGGLPDGTRRLSIPVAENLTTEPAAGAWLTAALRDEAIRAGLRVEGSAGVARLAARVLDVKAVPRGVAMDGGRFRSREQEIVVRVELGLEQAGEDWKVELTDRESYLSAPDLRGTEANRNIALQRVLERLARKGIERLARRF